MPDETMSFSSVKARLDEIAEEVAREDISLDDALVLYEEAVKLGLAACDLSEADLAPSDEESTAEDVVLVTGEEPVRVPVSDDVPYGGEVEGV